MNFSRAVVAGALLVLVIRSVPASAADRDCGEILPRIRGTRISPRPLEARDLLRLRDIGAAAALPSGAHAFSISPDGSRVAFLLRRAEPRHNLYCQAVIVMDVRAGAPPRIVDEGGDLIRWSFTFRGKEGFPSGMPKTLTPYWSRDGAWIFFLKKRGRITQVWRARSDGRGGVPFTRSHQDVDDLRLTPDGHFLLFATRPHLARARQGIDREAAGGYRYDDRYSPMSSSRPFPEGPVETRIFAQALSGGRVRPATRAEADIFVVDRLETSLSGAGRRSWLLPPQGDAFHWNRQIAAQDKDGATVLCSAPTCRSWASAPWWTIDGRHVRFFRREGWGQSTTAIYEWTVDGEAPRRLYATDDLLADCQQWKRGLVCLLESSLSPRRLVFLDPRTGRTITLFEPNPEFKRLTLGASERLQWENAYGVPSFGDLVYPVGYTPGRRYPLIIVQYQTRGFLRGGTGDEYPIQAFANRGYAVLSLERPRDYGYFIAAGEAGVDRADLLDFADRKSVQSSLETAVRMLADRGLIDPLRIGLTGLSDGASTVQYALINRPIFAAAAISNCCFDRSALQLVGPSATRHFEAEGYPSPVEPADIFWRPISLGLNARSIRTPLLLQLADDEYLTALESYNAIREAGTPIDMYVYEHEHHIKWQPVHRLAIYERNLAWFDYWLNHRTPPSKAAAVEAKSWEAMRDRASVTARAADMPSPSSQ
jgi:dipeptidyl aminopeptidase/acylaminoacyl peptidase